MNIDIHAHLFPQPFLSHAERVGLQYGTPGGPPMTAVPTFFDPDARLADLEAARLDVQVLSLGPPGVDGVDAPHSVALAQTFNEAIADVVARSPRRFAGLSTLPLQDPAAAVKELERGVRDLGMVGGQVFTNTRGRFLDEPEYWPVYEAAEALGAPLFIHPTNPVCVTGLDGPLMLGVAFLFDTTVAASRLVMNGVMARFPKLNLILAHLGATLPYILPRIDILSAGRSSLAAPPSAYFRRFYLDTVSYHGPAYRCALDTWGSERILLGSDYPYSRWDISVDGIDDLRLSDGVRAAICGDNARALLRGLPGGA